MNTIGRMLLIAIAFSAIHLSACGRSGNHDSFWFTDPPGTFHTNDVQKAQEEIPFQIILPAYVPVELESSPYIEGPVKGTCPDNSVGITVRYQAEETTGYYSLLIEEESGAITIYPASDARVRYIDIDGVHVMEQEYEQTTISPSGMNQRQAFEYTWNRHNVHFEVIISGYDRDEATKIVESMIQQVE